MNIFRTSQVITFWQFTVFQYRNDSPQIKRDLICGVRVSKGLRPLDFRKLENIIKLKTKLGQDLVPSLPCRIYYFPIAVKNYAKKNIKVFWSCLILLDFSTFCQVFGPQVKFNLFS